MPVISVSHMVHRLLIPLAAAEAVSDPLSGFEVDSHMLWRVGWAYALLVFAGIVVNVILFFRFQLYPLHWDQRSAALKTKPWAANEAVRVLLFLLGLYLAVSILKQFVTRPEDETPAWLILQSSFFHLTGIAFIAQALKRQGLTWRAAFGWNAREWRRDLARGVVLYFAMLPILFFYALLYQWVLRSLGYRPSPQEVVLLFMSETKWWARAYTLLLAAVIAPLFEEMVFRGIALPVLARWRGTAWAVTVLSFTFAAIHFHVASLVPLFVVALTLSIGYIYSGSLFVPIVTHALFNVVNLTVLTVVQIWS